MPGFEYAYPEGKVEYGSKNVFFVPPVAHWAYLRDNARKAEIGVMVDSDLDVIETENQALTDRQKLIQDTLINSTFINGETIVPNLARGVTAW